MHIVKTAYTLPLWGDRQEYVPVETQSMPRMDVAGSEAGMTGHREGGQPLLFDHGACSDIGCGRLRNEDAAWHTPNRFYGGGEGLVWAVADGIGGHHGGDVASRVACEQLRNYHAFAGGSGPAPPAALCRRLEKTILRADRHIRRMALADPGLAHMGTTLSCLVLTGTHSIIGHVGDSRVYRWRRNHLNCLTRDHTFVQEMIFEGELDPHRALTHPLRHMLTLAVGTAEPLEYVETRIDRLRPDDRFLLCTDGLHHAVSDEHIAAHLSQAVAAADIAAALVDEALHRHTRDNVTAVIIKIEGGDPAGQSDPAALIGG